MATSRPSWLRLGLPPVAVFLASMAIAQGIVELKLVPAWLLPPPTRVLAALWNQWSVLGPALWFTTRASLAGFALSVLVGVGAAVLMVSSRWVQRAFYPYAVFFQTVPIIAIAPLLVIWFGWGMQTIIIAAFIVSIFPVLANALTGLLSTDPALKDLFRLYGASRWATLFKLRLPAALPSIMTGLRIAGGLAVIGAIVAEMVVGQSGLGAALAEARQRQNTDVVFAGVLLAAFLGLGFFALVNLLAHLVLHRWHASEQ